jgi:C-terminal processing protease CtpA/Prc
MGSPAEAAGLIKEDRIIKINGVDLTALPALKGSALLTKYQEAAAGDTVSLTILRSGAAKKVGPVTKEVMRPPTVFLEYAEGIPVIQITEFSTLSGYDEAALDKTSNTIKELRAALTEVKKKGTPPVGIIDIRGNPGGELNQCYDAIDELVASGIYIQIEQHDVNEELQTPVIIKTPQQAKPGGLGEDIPWIFLADSGSASAAEIMLFAVKNCRPETYIIGETSYGKGVGQFYNLTPIAGGLFGITALKVFDKDWVSYHGIGIVPDEPTDSADALEKAVEYALSKHPQARSALDAAAPIDRAALRALNDQLTVRQIPPGGIRGGAWQLLDGRR